MLYTHTVDDDDDMMLIMNEERHIIRFCGISTKPCITDRLTFHARNVRSLIYFLDVVYYFWRDLKDIKQSRALFGTFLLSHRNEANEIIANKGIGTERKKEA